MLVAAGGTEAVALTHRPAAAHAVPQDFDSPSAASDAPQPRAAARWTQPTTDPVPPAAPVQLSIPSLHLTAPVTKVSLTTAGSLAVPADPHVVGWWQASAMAGSGIGTTVLDGHVDTAEQGRGTLFHLQDLPAGASLVLRTADGRAHTYRVTTRRLLKKSGGLPADLFSPTAPGTLAVVTCGGPFDRTKRSYRDNVVVLARPV